MKPASDDAQFIPRALYMSSVNKGRTGVRMEEYRVLTDTDEGACDGSCSHHGRCCWEVCVDEVVLTCEEHEHHAGAEWYRSEDTRDPRDFRRDTSPRKDEQADTGVRRDTASAYGMRTAPKQADGSRLSGGM